MDTIQPKNIERKVDDIKNRNKCQRSFKTRNNIVQSRLKFINHELNHPLKFCTTLWSIHCYLVLTPFCKKVENKRQLVVCFFCVCSVSETKREGEKKKRENEDESNETNLGANAWEEHVVSACQARCPSLVTYVS